MVSVSWCTMNSQLKKYGPTYEAPPMDPRDLDLFLVIAAAGIAVLSGLMWTVISVPLFGLSWTVFGVTALLTFLILLILPLE